MESIGQLGLVAVLLYSVSVSLHCAGMCCPIVAAGLLNDKATFAAKLVRVLRYNLARGCGYGFAGILLGGFGAQLSRWGDRVQLGGFWMSQAMGFLLLAWGMRQLHSWARGYHWYRSLVKAVHLDSIFASTVPMRQTLGRTGVSRYFRETANFFWRQICAIPLSYRDLAVGFGTVLLPCAVLLPAFALALSAGSASKGLAVMLAFFLGTLPVMVVTPLIPGTMLNARLRGSWQFLAPLFLIFAGLVTMLRGSEWIHKIMGH